ncbi:MAG TPA: sulfite exporter TauE/SafE family protein [Ruminococcaceae bacterium]|nr:sulfite exporter TauE/SafE family protein [Oscillospiraceae bacterium]HBI55104.1 sulfite exporter TauE/SafE family protein [Oscillospiraceae bacterium]
MKDIIFLIVLFIANVIQAITGFAGTVLAMPASMFLLGVDNAKVVLNVIALLSGLLIAISSYKRINKKLLKICVFMLIGMAVRILLCKVISSNSLLIIYGIIIIVIAGKNLLFHKEHKLPQAFLIAILIIAGIIHGMFVSGGALLVVYATQVLKDKEEFRATVAPVWIVLNSILLVSQIQAHAFNYDNIKLILLSIIPLIVATWIGKKLLKRVSQKVFLNLTYILLIISGISLIV